MNNEQQAIITIIINYLKRNPEQRFGQALFNLGINEFEVEDANTKTKSQRYLL